MSVHCTTPEREKEKETERQIEKWTYGLTEREKEMEREREQIDRQINIVYSLNLCYTAGIK